MKMLIIKGEIHLIETDNQEEISLISDSNITDHTGGFGHIMKQDGGIFDNVIACEDTQKILDDYYKNKI